MTEWRDTAHAEAYLERADTIPHRSEGEAVLIEELPSTVRRVLDLGAGGGRLMGIVQRSRPGAGGIVLDFSPPMLERLRARFDRPGTGIEVIEHDLSRPLPCLGTFDTIVSSFAIHHLEHDRKRQLYAEIWSILEPCGVFCNLEHVASRSDAAHRRFLTAMGIAPADEDPSNRLLDVDTQLGWLRVIGFVDVDCFWRYRELALLAGRKKD
jgi:SAM-dependent methyltransferase